MFDTAPVSAVGRLLELFPLARLREVWPSLNGSKEDVCDRVAETVERRRIAAFIDRHISCCRQHVHVFTIDSAGEFVLPGLIGKAEQLIATAGRSLYLTRSINRFVLRNPVEEITSEFLWPMCVELVQGYVLVRVVVVEKNIALDAGRPYYISDHGVDESEIVKAFAESGKLIPADLHKGIKRLWAAGVVHCQSTTDKKPGWRASEVLAEALRIREPNPDLEALSESPRDNTLFTIRDDPETSIETFSADPCRGTLAFARCTEAVGDTDRVIRRILESNQ